MMRLEIKSLLALLSISLVVLVACPEGKKGSTTTTSASMSSTDVITGKLNKINGKATVNGSPAKIGQTVKEKDSIKADDTPESFVDIEFTNGDKLRIQNGEMSLSQLAEKRKVNLSSGKLFADIKKVTSPTDFTIDTPISQLGVRGTTFYVEEKPQETYLCVCQGTVWGKKKGDPEDATPILVNKNEDLHVGKDVPIGEVQNDPAKIKMMTDMLQPTWDDMGVSY